MLTHSVLIRPYAEARAEARAEREHAAAVAAVDKRSAPTAASAAVDRRTPTPSSFSPLPARVSDVPVSGEDVATYKSRKEAQIRQLELRVARLTSEVADLADKGSGKRRRRSGGTSGAAAATESSSGSEAGGSPPGEGGRGGGLRGEGGEGYVSPTTALEGAMGETRQQPAAVAACGSATTLTADTSTAVSARGAVGSGAGRVRAVRAPVSAPGMSPDDVMTRDDDKDVGNRAGAGAGVESCAVITTMATTG